MNKIILLILFPIFIFAGSLPDSIKTPGDTVRFTMLMYICNKESLEDQPISNNIKNIVFRNYKIPYEIRNKYELDYLIPVNLGGNAEVKNVWPQYKTGIWSVYRKNKLEDMLNWMVCNAKITLREARFVIRKDWVKAYKYYILKDTTIIIEVK